MLALSLNLIFSNCHIVIYLTKHHGIMISSIMLMGVWLVGKFRAFDIPPTKVQIPPETCLPHVNHLTYVSGLFHANEPGTSHG
jgi:hypothetical protein